MFNVGLFEIILISVVALLVLGPERLPGAVRTIGLWVGRLRRSFNNIRREIEQEIGADDIRRQLRNEAIMEKFNSTKRQVTDTVDSVKKETQALKDSVDIKKQAGNLADSFKEGPADNTSTNQDSQSTAKTSDTNSPQDQAGSDPIDSITGSGESVTKPAQTTTSTENQQAKTQSDPDNSKSTETDSGPISEADNDGQHKNKKPGNSE